MVSVRLGSVMGSMTRFSTGPAVSSHHNRNTTAIDRKDIAALSNAPGRSRRIAQRRR